jgi:4-hydroxybutyrate CoA-transferase
LQTMITTANGAVQCIHSGFNIFIHTAAAAPQVLIQELVKRAPELSNVNIFQLHTEGEAPYADPEYDGIFNINALFIGSNVRQCIQKGRGSYIPVFLSEVPLLFKRKIVPLDAALISVSPPDEHGYCSLGVSIDASKAAIEEARIVIAQINPFMPRTHGDGYIHIHDIDYAVEHAEPIPEVMPPQLSDLHLKIGGHVAQLIEDRSTLQMGIGAVPNAVLASLHNHKDLGIHSEMFSDGIVPLVEKGVITGKYKDKHRHKIVGSFMVGSRKLYDFVDDNPMIRMLDCDYVNRPSVISKHKRMVAINSAIEVDLTGQVCADSIGNKMYSGVGGQMDFIRGSSVSEGGKPIIAMPSVTGRGESRIVVELKRGAGVVTTRSHVHWVVTEYGAANLFGRSLKERARILIHLAHPDHREKLNRNLFDIHGFSV